MTSVLLRIISRTRVQVGNDYVPNLQSGASSAALVETPTDIADQPPEVITVEVHAEGQEAAPEMPAAAAGPPVVKTSSAARHQTDDASEADNRVIAAMQKEGWKADQPG